MGFDFKNSYAVNNIYEEHRQKNLEIVSLQIIKEAISNHIRDKWDVDKELNNLGEEAKKECLKLLLENIIYSSKKGDKYGELGYQVLFKEHYDDPNTYRVIGEDLIRLTAQAIYNLRKGYLDVGEESRCVKDQMHELFIRDKNNSKFEFEEYPEYSIYRPYDFVSIIIIHKQINDPKDISIPAEIKEKNAILFDTQITTMVNNLSLCSFELPRFKGTFKQNEKGEWELKRTKIEVPLNLIEKLKNH